MIDLAQKALEAIRQAAARFATSEFVRTEDGFLRLEGRPPSIQPSTASFTLTRMVPPPAGDEVAPFGFWLRATDIAGFDVSEPPGNDNAYDPTQREITWVWNTPDEGYTPISEPNIWAVWKNRNVAYGKQIAHVFTTPGNKTVSCFGFDRSGNWAIAEHVFADDGGQSPAVKNPDVRYAGNLTICFSQEGNFEGAPAGATLVTSQASLSTTLTSRYNAGATSVRVLLRRGETYTDPGNIGASGFNRGLYVGAYGPGANPPKIVATGRTGFLNPRDHQRYCVFTDFECEGTWDSTTETGNDPSFFSNLGVYHDFSLIHRVKMSGLQHLVLSEAAGPWHRIISDVHVTNWKNYGIVGSGGIEWFAAIDSRIHQHVDALNGINQGGSRQEPTNLGNLHGPLRFSGLVTNTYIARTSFFSRNGWSLSQSTGYTVAAPTAEQACIRFNTQSSGLSTKRHHHFWDRSLFEGGVAGNVQLNGNGDWDNGTQNLVIDKAIFLGGSMTGGFSGTVFRNVTFRNCYGVLLNLTRRGWNSNRAAFDSAAQGHQVYNCTILNLRTNGDGFGTEIANIFAATGSGGISADNVLRQPFKVPEVGAGLEPLGTTVMPGVTSQNKGQRFNFPPIGIDEGTVAGNFRGPFTVSSRRELGPGNLGPGEWMSFPYPDYTGLCNGAGFAVTQATILAHPTQRHQVSVTSVSTKRMGDRDLWPGADNRVKFDFTPTAIRIQNNTSGTWTGTSQVWVQLDLSQHLMDHVADTSSFGATIPIPSPGTGSEALIVSYGARNAYDYIDGSRRPDSINPATGSAVTGQRAAGAFAP